MSHICHVRIRKVSYEYPEICPFSMVGVRELSRRTGLDKGFLSRVQTGKLAISEQQYALIDKAAMEYVSEQTTAKKGT